MTYSPSPDKAGNVVQPALGSTKPTSMSNFGGLRVDANRIGMTGALANNMKSQDATATPVTSPVTVNTTKTLTVPLNAVSITISPVTNAVQVSEDSTQSAYFALPAGTTWTFECANQEYIYLKTSGSTVVSFYFSLV